MSSEIIFNFFPDKYHTTSANHHVIAKCIYDLLINLWCEMHIFSCAFLHDSESSKTKLKGTAEEFVWKTV